MHLLAGLAAATVLQAAGSPVPEKRDYVIRDFKFRSGESLTELKMHYLTLGTPQRDADGVVRNAILILHGTTGSSAQFLGPEFAGELYGEGQPLDPTRYYLIIPDNIGHGQSSKPSDGLRARFPRYGYHDMIEAQRRLLVEGLDVTHLRLVMGTSMGGMHTWLWGELYPGFMDALMPLGSLPTQISGRNRVWRRVVIDAIRLSPDWNGGDYTVQPVGLRTAAQMLFLMGSNPVLRLQEAPTLAEADVVMEDYIQRILETHDANDVMYAFAASEDYDPSPGLEEIQARLVAINSADDLINPPELGSLERQIQRVKHGKAIVLPYNRDSVGHGSHTKAVLWKKQLVRLLKKTERST